MKAVWLLAVALAAQQAPARFRVGVDAVRVDALVTDGNRPILGLKAEDFELRDNGVVQRIEAFGIDDVPISAMLALDTSGSVVGRPLEHLRDAARAVIATANVSDRFALITFSESIELLGDFSTQRSELTLAIDRVSASGSTALHDAAYTALRLNDREPGRRSLVLIFTDGDDTNSWLPGQAVIDVARRSDAVVYAVAVVGANKGQATPFPLQARAGFRLPVPPMASLAFYEEFLTILANETGGQVLRMTDTRTLREAFVHILTEFRTRYLLTYIPRGVETSGWHQIEVKLKGRKGAVRARRGYER